jgi:pimeloyl-ACP methyl ester carboxylesterase
LPRIARAWAVLMKRLGYASYVAQGGDWGAGVTTWMAKQHVEGLKAIHLNLPILFPPPLEGEPSAEEKAALAELQAYGDNGSAYARLQSTRPQTIGYSLSDSPVGQAAWIYEKLDQWSDPNDGPALSRDEMLDNIMLYWLSNTGASSARLYFESFASDFSTQKLDIPVAVSVFPGELYRPLKVWGGGPIASSITGTRSRKEGTLLPSSNPKSSSPNCARALLNSADRRMAIRACFNSSF